MTKQRNLSLRWKALFLITLVLMMASFGWHWQYQRIFTNYQNHLIASQTQNFQRLVNNTLNELQANIEDFAALLPLYQTETPSSEVKAEMEAQFINKGIVALYQIESNQRRLLYHDDNQTSLNLPTTPPKSSPQLSCTQKNCFLLFNLHTYTTNGKPLNLFIVQQASLWFQTLHQLLENNRQRILLTLANDNQPLLYTQPSQTHFTFTSTPHIESIQQQKWLTLPLELPLSHASNLHLWAVQNITPELTNWEKLKSQSNLQVFINWFIIALILLFFIHNRIKLLHQLESALSLAAKNQFKAAIDHLKFNHPPLLQDELHNLLRQSRKILKQMGQVHNQLEWLAYHDTLTGLPNRRSFYRSLNKLVQSQQGVLIFLNLNRFKQINDVYGHKVGDAVLKDFATKLQILNTPVPMQHFRLAGDEFTLIINQSIPDDTLTQYLSEFSQHLEGTLITEHQESVHYHASMGTVILRPPHTYQPNKLLHWADIAMYKAKHEDSTQHWHIFNPALDDDTEKQKQELELVNWIRKALTRTDAFHQVIQPIADIETGKIHHYEVLLRLNDEAGNPIYPDHFIPVAEHHGIIYDIDRWVLEHALIALKASPTETQFAVNLSAPSLQHPKMAKTVLKLLQKHQVPHHQLTIELTETAYVDNLGQVKHNLQQLKAAGIGLSLDDFGVGFTSFRYLTELHFDTLKIDGSFIKDLLSNPEHQAFVKGITEIAHATGLKVIAEFVENDDILAMLSKLKVDYAQGWGIGKPIPIQNIQNSKQR